MPLSDCEYRAPKAAISVARLRLTILPLNRIDQNGSLFARHSLDAIVQELASGHGEIHEIQSIGLRCAQFRVAHSFQLCAEQI